MHEGFMELALKEARCALDQGEVPIGAVMVYQGQLIAKGHNQVEQLKDPTAHAEMIVITQAANALDRWRLNGTTLYVTVEPCAMCAGALVLARVERIVFGASDPRRGACGSVINLTRGIDIIEGVLREACQSIIQGFFRCRRDE
jgi:tRNA(adenine34) deaminase